MEEILEDLTSLHDTYVEVHLEFCLRSQVNPHQSVLLLYYVIYYYGKVQTTSLIQAWKEVEKIIDSQLWNMRVIPRAFLSTAILMSLEGRKSRMSF